MTTAQATTLRELNEGARPLKLEERQRIVDQALVLIEQLYVHLPLKRAMHAVDPVQRLKLLRHRLEGLPERRFHDEMIDIFIGLRDLHTNYILPEPYRGLTAALPFRIEEFWEDGERRYIVTAVAQDLHHEHFEPGVEVTHWNGIPIDRAVDLQGARNGGSNLDARHARGLISMTQRPMALLAPPDEEWVEIGYVADDGPHRARFEWQMLKPRRARSAVDASDAKSPLAKALGIDALTESVRRAQKLVFAPEAMDLEQAAADGDVAADDAEVSTLPDVLEFRTVGSPLGEFGYLRIRTFSVNDVDEFIAEVVRILDLLPQNGLIVDVRGNGGGVIMAGERLLQLFTARQIEPERLHFINTPLTARLTRVEGLEQWQESVAEAIETGSTFSDGYPVFEGHAEDCNSTGQRYCGPVVLITDALCYSTTDIFAAGFQDHGIGPILGTNGNTGAGGANVWTHDLIAQFLAGDDSPIEPLPRGSGMRVSIRRTTRVGPRSGDPVEDLGIVPDQLHRMTRRDLLERNPDLIAAAAKLIADMPPRALSVSRAEAAGDDVTLAIRSGGIDRLDVYAAGRPRATVDVTDGDHAITVPREEPIDVLGYEAGQLVARRRLDAA